MLLPLCFLTLSVHGAAAPYPVHGAAAPYPVSLTAAARRFDGIGALSGGGTTSKLLPDYLAE